jgi:hypothetical protein
MQLRQMLVITDAAARRETGFDEADAPTDDELERMILMQLAVNPQTAAPALKELTGLELDMPAPVAPGQPPSGEDDEETPGQRSQPQPSRATKAEPDTQGDEPPEPGVTASVGRVRNARNGRTPQLVGGREVDRD